MSPYSTLSEFVGALGFRASLITIIVGLVTLKVAKFYYRVWKLPPGPFPLPILGNMFQVYRSFNDKRTRFEIFKELREKRGPVMTSWLGENPTVRIYDFDLA